MVEDRYCYAVQALNLFSQIPGIAFPANFFKFLTQNFFSGILFDPGVHSALLQEEMPE